MAKDNKPQESKEFQNFLKRLKSVKNYEEVIHEIALIGEVVQIDPTLHLAEYQDDLRKRLLVSTDLETLSEAAEVYYTDFDEDEPCLRTCGRLLQLDRENYIAHLYSGRTLTMDSHLQAYLLLSKGLSLTHDNSQRHGELHNGLANLFLNEVLGSQTLTEIAKQHNLQYDPKRGCIIPGLDYQKHDVRTEENDTITNTLTWLHYDLANRPTHTSVDCPIKFIQN